MAKKNKGKFDFSKVGKIMDGISEKTSIVIEDANAANSREFIDTGIYILNALLSKSILKGGIMSNRITALAGPSGVGKSFICYNICANAQKAGYNIVYIDTEFSIETEDLNAYGIDTSPDRFKLLRSNKVEDMKMFLTQMLDQLKEAKKEGYELDKMLFVIDSAGQLASNKEVDDAIAGKNKADMSRAKAIKSLFRIINGDLGILNIPLLVTNHTYMSMDLFPKPIMSGGTGLQYTASTIVFLSKAKLKTGEEDELSTGQSGIIVTAKANKNRLAMPKKVKFEINFATGCNPYKGLEFFCTPENFEEVGIAKGKMEADKETGEMKFKPGGTRWYVRSLGKSVFTKQLHTKEVFTDEVLEALDPIITKYFEYSDVDSVNESIQEFIKTQDEYDEYQDVDDIDSADATLFE
jgi:RecA/RadA recombinase